MKFEDFDFHFDLLDALDSMGFQTATPVQEQAIPAILDDKDIIAVAQTGTGKTAAFLLPVLNKIMTTEYPGGSSCLIITPTRELALQIDRQAEALGYFTGVSSVAVYGGGEGSDWDTQKKALNSGADIIVATPGRLLSHIKMGYFKLDKIKYLVLDEADRMLDMGFYGDIISINSELPKEKQCLLFSATMPGKFRKLAKELANDPVEVSIAISKPAANVLQGAYIVYEKQKPKLIRQLLKERKDLNRVIVFSSTKKAVNDIVKALAKVDFTLGAISSDLDQKGRELVMREFANGKVQVLVATDVISRGIDIKDIQLVINYDVPPDPEDYIHRIGRTARANASGIGLTFVSEKDQFRFGKIEELLGSEIRKMPMPEGIGEGPEYRPPGKRKPNYRRNKKKNYSKGKFRKGGKGKEGNFNKSKGGKNSGPSKKQAPKKD